MPISYMFQRILLIFVWQGDALLAEELELLVALPPQR
jgi:hypothetical protein